VDNVRFFLLGDEVACRIFGQAVVHLGQYFGVLALGVKLSQLSAQAGAFGRVWEMLLISGFGT
jgi:hypothetical protein